MNWKNITIEPGFIRQEITLKGQNATTYIPFEQIDTFGISNLENKYWLFAGIFFGLCASAMFLSGQSQAGVFTSIFCAGLVFVYFMTKKIVFTIASSQMHFDVHVRMTGEEISAANTFVAEMKKSLQSELNLEKPSAA